MRAALKVAYPTPWALIAIVQAAGLDPANLQVQLPVSLLVGQVLDQARTADRLEQLLVEVLTDPDAAAVHPVIQAQLVGFEAVFQARALDRKPSLAALAALAPAVGVLGPGMRRAGLEELLQPAAGFADVAVFRAALAVAEVRVARVEYDGEPRGTGFLVGERHLLTNWHVVRRLATLGPAGPDAGGAIARFDFKLSADGSPASAGRAVAFDVDWLAHKSEVGAPADELGAEGPPAGPLDYAVVRLAEPAGAQAIGPDPGAAGADRRGWYALSAAPRAFDPDEPILIVGHPLRRPLQISFASPGGAVSTAHANRVRYQTNTEAGSSGSPVFDRAWNPVALHHASGPAPLEADGLVVEDGRFNQGIPLALIAAELAASPIAHELSGGQGPSVQDPT